MSNSFYVMCVLAIGAIHIGGMYVLLWGLP